MQRASKGTARAGKANPSSPLLGTADSHLCPCNAIAGRRKLPEQAEFANAKEPVSSTLYGSRFLTGGVGGSVTHQCFYSTTPANKHDRKYWCKRAGSGVCYTIISTTGYVSKDHAGRVSLEDVPQNGTFMVTMTELKESDTGTYRCGIGITNRDLYVSLNLTVLAGRMLAGERGGSAPPAALLAGSGLGPDAGASTHSRRIDFFYPMLLTRYLQQRAMKVPRFGQISHADALGPTELIRGELRGSVTVLCPPGDTQGGEKRFWCKLGRTGCALIADTNGYVGKSYEGRIFISPQESSGAFKILINDLKKEDSGLYRCGTGRLSSRDSPRVVALQVTTASSLPKRPKFLSGTVGGSLSLKCHYDPKGNYEKKYLCRWKEASCSLLVDADGFVHESYEGRIQIASSDQENGTYTVVMSGLREEDAGWYWCGAKNGHTEHTSSVKLRIQKETCCSEDPETSTLVKTTLSSSPATYSTPTQRSSTGPTYAMGTVTESTSTPLPTAPPSTFVTSPSEIYRKTSSHESRLLPVVLPVLILLIFITIVILALTKIKLQKETGEERSAMGNLEAAPIQSDANPVKEQAMEETPSPEKVHKCRTDSGKRSNPTGKKILVKVTDEDLRQNPLPSKPLGTRAQTFPCGKSRHGYERRSARPRLLLAVACSEAERPASRAESPQAAQTPLAT
ncbi:hypothetical protein QYF61_016078, partial [Mycteria americana]